MALATLVCSVISAAIAIIDMLSSIINSVIDVHVTYTQGCSNSNKALRITINNNSDNSVKINNVVVMTTQGPLNTQTGTTMFSPFDKPYVLVGHDSYIYGYTFDEQLHVKQITVTFSKRVSLLSHKETIYVSQSTK